MLKKNNELNHESFPVNASDFEILKRPQEAIELANLSGLSVSYCDQAIQDFLDNRIKNLDLFGAKDFVSKLNSIATKNKKHCFVFSAQKLKKRKKSRAARKVKNKANRQRRRKQK